MAKRNEIDVPATLESILCTAELDRRPSRPPDYETENRALAALGQALADSPRTILQTLADTIVDVFQSDSGGISLLTKDEKRFYWPAIAGVWKPHLGGGTPAISVPAVTCSIATAHCCSGTLRGNGLGCSVTQSVTRDAEGLRPRRRRLWHGASWPTRACALP